MLITCDLDALWSDFDHPLSLKTSRCDLVAMTNSSNKTQPAPHDDLYTRLQPSANGIGVFAIRDIAPGTILFAGDAVATTRITMQEVEQIEDQEIKRMYLDFCPVVDGAFVAPQNFNQITMGWYLNHSDDPNVRAENDLTFIAHRFIAKGEELRVDYRTYSERAVSLTESWKAGRLEAGAGSRRRPSPRNPRTGRFQRS